MLQEESEGDDLRPDINENVAYIISQVFDDMGI